jgi:hypothetical protein
LERPHAIWEVVTNALGRSNPSLPDAVMVNCVETSGSAEAAEAVNAFYVRKVAEIRELLVGGPPALGSDWLPKSR